MSKKSEPKEAVDPVEDMMEEIACVAEMWLKNKNKGRKSPRLFLALISASQELVQLVEDSKK